MDEHNNEDVVISSRIRFARNIANIPFPNKCSNTEANKVINMISNALGDSFAKCDFDMFSESEKQSYIEKHIISREFAISSNPHALYSDIKGIIRIMIGEEDHIRIQAITGNFSLTKAYDEACKVDDLLASKLNIAFDDKFGYLTHCPTNLGTAMRASVMIFLPGIVKTKRINPLLAQLSKLGITVRGIYGEGSESQGCIFQVSNRETIGVTEDEIISKLSKIVMQIIELERQARDDLKNMLGDNLIDCVMRSLGKLKYAHLLSLAEFMDCYSDIRMGISLGIINEINYLSLDSLFAEVMPGTLCSRTGCERNESSLSLERAKRVKEMI